ncbi:MAG: type IV pilin, partial [Methanosarcinaceae archaeon]|nr:type IV pilin [Methanosarcinaceae archaeon]
MNAKLFLKNKKAVSPVIGVVLMVAITVILAAAIGSSVFGKGTSDPAPQANLNIKALSPYEGPNEAAVINFEHLGGDPINFTSNSTTKVMATIGSTSAEVNAKSLSLLDVGETKSISLNFSNKTAISSAKAGTT